jgi:D-alanine-D-alanine ligase
MSGRTSVAVVMGGVSAEREISLKTGAAVAGALDPERFETRPVVVEADGSWRVGKRSLVAEERGVPAAFPFETLSAGRAVESLRERGTAIAFVALHGRGGEDGVVQGLFESVGLPYTGSGVTASALAMDKPLARVVLRGAGLVVAEGMAATEGEWRRERAAILGRIASAVGYPCFVKPAAEGSSVGVRRAAGPEEIPAAVEEALGYGPRFLVEREVAGTEVTCAVLGNHHDEKVLAFPPIEIVARSEGFFTWKEKYDPEGAEEICPPRSLSDEAIARVREAAMSAHRALGCDGLTRTDMILDRSGIPFVLEVNTLPGLTERSLVPKAAAAAGISFGELCARIVETGLRRVVRSARTPIGRVRRQD